jgi:membrane associated rhomboid family serine protease
VTTVTRTLILANVCVFVLQAFCGDALLASFALWPLGRYALPDLGSVGFRPWQLVTSAFLHANVAHLLLNMFALHIFGRDVERALGARRYLILYSAAVLSAGCAQLAVSSVSPNVEPYPTIGASGGIFGVLLAFGVLYPHRIVTLVFPPIPMPAWLFVTLYGAIELANGVLGTEAGVAHFAHLGGMLGGYLALRAWWRRDKEGAWPPEALRNSPDDPIARNDRGSFSCG